VCIGAQNYFEAAYRLREETGLESYDGGWFRSGIGNRIVPLGNDQYVEIESVIDPVMAEGHAIARYIADSVSLNGGDALVGWCVRTDTLDELERVGARLGLDVRLVRNRVRPDGSEVEYYTVPLSIDVWPKGLPSFLFWPVAEEHPGRGYAAHRVTPRGIAWVEVGGAENELRDWLGPEGASLHVRFAGGAPGVRAVGIATGGPEIVVRRHPA
jgi:hypothetical protein